MLKGALRILPQDKFSNNQIQNTKLTCKRQYYKRSFLKPDFLLTQKLVIASGTSLAQKGQHLNTLNLRINSNKNITTFCTCRYARRIGFGINAFPPYDNKRISVASGFLGEGVISDPDSVTDVRIRKSCFWLLK